MGEPRLHVSRADDELDIGRFVEILRHAWWRISLFAVVVGVATFLILLSKPNLYRASARIAVVSSDDGEASQFRALATSIGALSRSSVSIEDLKTLLASRDLAVRVFAKYNPWPELRPFDFNVASGQFRVSRMTRFLDKHAGEWRDPNDWDAIGTAARALTLSVDHRSGTVEVSFESRSPMASLKMVEHFLDEAKSRLQEEALARAERNKMFIEEQIAKMVDPLSRDRFYALYGHEVEREMLARNPQEFGFKVIDSPRMPNGKSGPHRASIAILAAFLAGLAGCVASMISGHGRERS